MIFYKYIPLEIETHHERVAAKMYQVIAWASGNQEINQKTSCGDDFPRPIAISQLEQVCLMLVHPQPIMKDNLILTFNL